MAGSPQVDAARTPAEGPSGCAFLTMVLLFGLAVEVQGAAGSMPPSQVATRGLMGGQQDHSKDPSRPRWQATSRLTRRGPLPKDPQVALFLTMVVLLGLALEVRVITRLPGTPPEHSFQVSCIRSQECTSNCQAWFDGLWSLEVVIMHGTPAVLRFWTIAYCLWSFRSLLELHTPS